MPDEKPERQGANPDKTGGETPSYVTGTRLGRNPAFWDDQIYFDTWVSRYAAWNFCIGRGRKSGPKDTGKIVLLGPCVFRKVILKYQQ